MISCTYIYHIQDCTAAPCVRCGAVPIQSCMTAYDRTQSPSAARMGDEGMGRTGEGDSAEGKGPVEILVAIDTAPSFRRHPESWRLWRGAMGVGVSGQTENKPSRGRDGLASKDT